MLTSEKTWIGKIRVAMDRWMSCERMDRESLVRLVDEAHEAMGGRALSGVSFAPNCSDDWMRQRMMVDRLFSWLDDESKGSHLMPANFLPSLLMAMPEELRVACLNDLLEPLGLEVFWRNRPSSHPDTWMDEFRFAYTSLLEVVDVPDLDAAMEVLKEAMEAKREARWMLEEALMKVQGLHDLSRLS